MKKRFLFIIFLFFSFSLIFCEDAKKFKIKKIKYLSSDVIDEKVLRTYLGFKEGDYFTEKTLDILIDLATLRLREYGIFNNIEIFSSNSEISENEKIIFIKLDKGFIYAINASLYWGQVGWKNFLNRGDYIGFVAGINRNIFESKHHFPVGFIYYQQQIGWEWVLRNPYIPFFPLYGNQSNYIHSAFYIGKFGFKLHPDINFGIYFGEKSQFLNNIKNLQSFETTNYSFEHIRSGILIGGFINSDTRYLIKKYRFGHKINVEGGINIDVTGKNIYPELLTDLKFDFMPHDYIFMFVGGRLYNQFTNTLTYTKFNIRDFQRGSVSKGTIYGNFLFDWNFDFRVKLASWSVGALSQTIGLSSFYEGFLITDDYNIIEQKESIEYKNIIGGGLWLKFGSPVNISIFAELGYTIGEEFTDGYKINIGVADFF
ncbi:MAG: hypothetical protein A2086_13175 [Spirochaetes bacterium GWD1_27_9]|nr:MAG: hypothetical protein A2Z98_01010 [Spirochaetes bacterium GWB1_27_13]OHD44070.1 MAG: hypothetical protein A2086_13175 [Spirochaetes bacterium GWD1_27_9]